MTDRPTCTNPRTEAPGDCVGSSRTPSSASVEPTTGDSELTAAWMHERLVEMRGGVSWNHLTGLWHASASLPDDRFGATSGCYASANTPEAAVAESYAEWVKLGRPSAVAATELQRKYVEQWARERDEDAERGAAMRGAR